MRRFALVTLFLLVAVLSVSCASPASTTANLPATAAPQTTAEPTAAPTAAPTSEPTAEPTPEPTLEPTVEPGISTEMDDMAFDINEDYNTVYVLNGTLDGQAVTLFMTGGATSNDGKQSYCYFYDCFGFNKCVASQKMKTTFDFDIKDAYGDVMPMEYLPGDFKADGAIALLQDYLKNVPSGGNADLTALKTVGDLRKLYEQVVPRERWFIAPKEQMRAIDPRVCVETFVVDGKEKLLFVTRSDFALGTGRPAEFSSYDLITGEKLYDSDEANLTPAKPAKAVPFAEYFKDVQYKRAYTLDELIEFYKANIPEDKQHFYQPVY